MSSDSSSSFRGINLNDSSAAPRRSENNSAPSEKSESLQSDHEIDISNDEYTYHDQSSQSKEGPKKMHQKAPKKSHKKVAKIKQVRPVEDVSQSYGESEQEQIMNQQQNPQQIPQQNPYDVQSQYYYQYPRQPIIIIIPQPAYMPQPYYPQPMVQAPIQPVAQPTVQAPIQPVVQAPIQPVVQQAYFSNTTDGPHCTDVFSDFRCVNWYIYISYSAYWLLSFIQSFIPRMEVHHNYYYSSYYRSRYYYSGPYWSPSIIFPPLQLLVNLLLFYYLYQLVAYKGHVNRVRRMICSFFFILLLAGQLTAGIIDGIQSETLGEIILHSIFAGNTFFAFIIQLILECQSDAGCCRSRSPVSTNNQAPEI